ncbi:MAG: mechanosensitive ion channel [Vicingaceae bacterium]
MEFTELISSPLLRRLFFVALGIIVAYTAAFYLKKGINKSISDSDRKYRARKAINVFSYLFIIGLIAFIYNDKLGNLGIAIGVTGAGVALALQEVILSVAGWIVIVFSGKVTVGQRVKIGQIKGDIMDISVMSTTLMELGDWISGDLYNGRIVSLSNSYVFKETIHNYSAGYPFLWDEIQIPLRHQSDYQLAQKLFEEIAEEVCGDYALKSAEKWAQLSNKYMVENARVKPMVSLSFDQNWITFTIRYVVDYKMRRTTKNSIYRRVLEELKNNGDAIQVATAAMEVTIPSLSESLSKKE